VKLTVAQLLAESGLPAFDARALLAHRLGVPRERLITRPDAEVSEADAGTFLHAALRRARGEPLAYLLGTKEFYGRDFRVTPAVLVPRPDTELLVDLALGLMRPTTRPRVLDLGTGTGCIAVTLALEHPGAEVTATDASPAALAIAQDNAHQLGATRVRFRAGDWYSAVPADAVFDLIVSNPPYIASGDPHLAALRFEPPAALTDGGDGLACLRAVIDGSAAHLTEHGWLIVEHGYDQAEVVQALIRQQGWSPATNADAGGHPRVTLAQRRTPTA
jgi:release factor glutamine methyltransferase